MKKEWVGICVGWVKRLDGAYNRIRCSQGGNTQQEALGAVTKAFQSIISGNVFRLHPKIMQIRMEIEIYGSETEEEDPNYARAILRLQRLQQETKEREQGNGVMDDDVRWGLVDQREGDEIKGDM